MTRRTRIVLLGYGAINRLVVQCLQERSSPVQVTGVIRRGSTKDRMDGFASITEPSQLEALRPDLVLEAATRDAITQWGEVALRSARKLVISSSSALTDDVLLNRFLQCAREHGSQVVLSPGAIAGMDALSAASRLGLREVRHRIVKPTASWGASMERIDRASDPGAVLTLFSGSARDAADRYPLNANVSVVAALAGVGLDQTVVELIADPTASSNRHEIRARGDFGSLCVQLENQPLFSNPKSSTLAALALVRIAENEITELVL